MVAKPRYRDKFGRFARFGQSVGNRRKIRAMRRRTKLKGLKSERYTRKTIYNDKGALKSAKRRKAYRTARNRTQ